MRVRPSTARASAVEAAGSEGEPGGAEGAGGVAQGRAASEAASSGVNLNHLSAKPPLVRAASQNVTYSSSVSSAFRSAGVEIDDTKDPGGAGVVKSNAKDSAIWREGAGRWRGSPRIELMLAVRARARVAEAGNTPTTEAPI